MLNPFPELLIYGDLAPLILRLALGCLFISTGYLKLTREKNRWAKTFEVFRVPKPVVAVQVLGMVELISGMMIVLGLYTQIAALIIVLISFSEIWVELQEETLIVRSLAFYILVFAIAASLLFSGAGFHALGGIPLAFDLPL